MRSEVMKSNGENDLKRSQNRPTKKKKRKKGKTEKKLPDKHSSCYLRYFTYALVSTLCPLPDPPPPPRSLSSANKASRTLTLRIPFPPSLLGLPNDDGGRLS